MANSAQETFPSSISTAPDGLAAEMAEFEALVSDVVDNSGPHNETFAPEDQIAPEPEMVAPTVASAPVEVENPQPIARNTATVEEMTSQETPKPPVSIELSETGELQGLDADFFNEISEDDFASLRQKTSEPEPKINMDDMEDLLASIHGFGKKAPSGR